MKPISIHWRSCLEKRLATCWLLVISALLGGCNTLEQSQLGQTASALLSHDRFDVAQARALPHASLRFTYDGNIGMVVLAALNTVRVRSKPPGKSASHEAMSAAAHVASHTTNELARFETADHAFIRLENGLLTGTAGFEYDLLEMQRDVDLRLRLTRLSTGELQPTYRVRSRWQRTNGGQGYAEGTASWQCDAPTLLALPLGEQRVFQCRENIRWDNGEKSLNRLAVAFARHPTTVYPIAANANEIDMQNTSHASHRLSSQVAHVWAADIQPWPGAPRWKWEVARAWW